MMTMRLQLLVFRADDGSVCRGKLNKGQSYFVRPRPPENIRYECFGLCGDL